MEVRDKLQVNDFYNESGIIETTVHGKYSRIEINIVDTRKGGKEKAQIGEFNLTPKEIKTLLSLINLDGNTYKKNVTQYNKENGEPADYFSILKLHHFKKDNNGKSPVFNLKVSFESAMKQSSKWKFTIETGKGIATCSEQRNGGRLYYVKEGTYTKDTVVSFFLNSLELLELKNRVLAHLEMWENYNYGKMLSYREEFCKRAKLNNYDESSIDIWNEKNVMTSFNKSVKQEQSSNIENSQHISADHTEGYCSKCGCKTSKNILEYTKKTIGKPLCLNCKEEM